MPETIYDPLAPKVWPAEDEYFDPAVWRASERFWWHSSVSTFVIAEYGAGRTAVCTPEIADAVWNNVLDINKWCRSMIGWGELVRAEPQTDAHPDLWVAMASAPTDAEIAKAQRQMEYARRQRRYGQTC